MKVLVVIPARYESRRFPGKPLVEVAGKPVIKWVWEAAMVASTVHTVVVATDDPRVYEAVKGWGGFVDMTPPDLPSGTDRVAEVAKRMRGYRYVINLQADEPTITPEVIDSLVRALEEDPSADMATPAVPVSREEVENPNRVKVIIDHEGYALYFSRALIPYPYKAEPGHYLKHLGVYAFRRQLLLDFAHHRPTSLERVEGLEQLRALEIGMRIKVVLVEGRFWPVDTPEDIPRVEEILRERG